MSIVDLIIKKRQGQALAADEIAAFVKGVCDGSWKDYQIAAMLMAMFIRGLDPVETTGLTLAMAHSGDLFDLSRIPGIKVDKHSTGGVADTTTLILLPLVAACGAPVVKISGRGLGFTGGTVDKLESIPGFKVHLSAKEAIDLVMQSQAVILSQSDNLTPADKKLYALRDVTGTIDNIPLIAASIMSKKIAAGADAIVLDVKCGSGAFMQDLESARKLAQTMVDIGRLAGRKVVSVISGMSQPLGMNVGNALEVIEAIEVLKGNALGDLLEVTLVLGSQMLILAGLAENPTSARRLLQNKLQSGAGLQKFREIIINQGGDPRIIDDYQLLPQPACRGTLKASTSGFITAMDTAAIGRAFVEAGGGRKAKEDPIDYAAGFIFKHRLGDYIGAGDEIAAILAATEEKVRLAHSLLDQAIQIGNKAPKPEPVIIAVVQ